MYRILTGWFLLAISIQLQAEDWPEFRGPTAQGHAAGKLPVTWSNDKNIAWQVGVPGQGWSSPVIVASRVYLTTAVEKDDKSGYSLRCLCLDAQTGKSLWDTEVFQQSSTSPRIHNKNSHASPTPIVNDDKCYVHFGHQGTACLDLDGKILWKNKEHFYKPVHGNGGSPCLCQNTLVICCDGENLQAVIGLDCKSGKTLWKTDRNAQPGKPFSFGTPLSITFEGKQQVICAGSDVVMSLDPSNGKELWRFRYKGYSQIPRPLFHAGLLYICTGYDSPKLLAIKAGGHGDVTDTHLAWQVTRNVPNTPSPIIVGDAFYMVADNGVMSCLDAITGTQRWQGRLSGGFSASLLHADGKIYCLNEKGDCSVVAIDAKFKELGKNSLPGRTLASPSPYAGKLYIRTDEKLYCIETKP